MSRADSDSLFVKIKNLNELLWEGRVTRPELDQWLENFSGDCMPEELERVHALFLLTKFLYFGQKEVYELLRAMFRDLFRHRLSVMVRQSLVNKDDFDMMHIKFEDELRKTRFLGLGNPAESGTHILYYFRQINALPKEIFANPHDLFSDRLDDPGTKWNREVRRLVFIDDFCGTGKQAKEMGVKYVPLMRRVAENSKIKIKVWYLTLLATTSGLNNVRACGVFDHVEAVSELDSTYRVFDPSSQVYVNPPNSLLKGDAETIVRHYGELLQPGHPLGFRDCQLLVGFHHNVPDNTLPIISREMTNPRWHPIFRRFDKF